MKTYGLRDIIGPIMVGPSSSHTAGALALASMARKLFGEQPERAVFTLYGSFAATGSGHGKIIFHAILPNILSPLIVDSTMRIGGNILQISGLSFIGLGVAAPLPSLGSLATDAVKGMNTYPHLLIAPALMISVMILVFNLFGDGLRDAFDPKLKN